MKSHIITVTLLCSVGCGYVENPNLVGEMGATMSASDDVDTSTDTTGTSTIDDACGSFGCACLDNSTCDPGLECIDGACLLWDSSSDTESGMSGAETDCDVTNEYCTDCMNVLEVDPDLDGTSDGGFCHFMCMNGNASMCPALDRVQIQCMTWNRNGDQACFAICELADDCPQGMFCIDIGIGPGGVCVADVESLF